MKTAGRVSIDFVFKKAPPAHNSRRVGHRFISPSLISFVLSFSTLHC